MALHAASRETSFPPGNLSIQSQAKRTVEAALTTADQKVRATTAAQGEIAREG